MEMVLSLWLPIVLPAAAVFIASSFVHMVLPFHKGDMSKLAREDEVMAVLRPSAIPPGDYAVPCAGFLPVFRLVGAVAFAVCSLALAG